MDAIAEVAIPISFALNEHFDYLVPENIAPKVIPGCRVIVPFRDGRLLGYVLRLKKTSPFGPRLKTLFQNLDAEPVLDKKSLDLAAFLQREYFCSFAEAIRVILPPGLRNADKKGAVKQAQASFGSARKASMPDGPAGEPSEASGPRVPIEKESEFVPEEFEGSRITLFHDLSQQKKWPLYAALIKEGLREGRSVIFLVPDHRKIEPAVRRLAVDAQPFILTSHLAPKKNAETWLAVRKTPSAWVVGTRGAILAPVQNLKTIIIDEEEHFAYKQDQVPFYDARKVAFERADSCGGRVILGSLVPSLETWSLVRRGRASCVRSEADREVACVQLIDAHTEIPRRLRRSVISKNLEYRIASCLDRRERMLLFSLRKGFSTFLYCRKCNATQTCPRCSSALGYFFKEKKVVCPTCHHEAASFDVCPACKSSYVRYLGFGAEKIESEILRLFPSARVAVFGEKTDEDVSDIMLATPEFLESPEWDREAFDHAVVLDTDRMLGYPDFRASERAFARFFKLRSLVKKNVYLQTAMADYYALRFLQQGDLTGFLDDELRRRKESGLPPSAGLAILKIRARKDENAKGAALEIYGALEKSLCRKKKVTAVLEPAPCTPRRIRGNFYYQVLIKYRRLDAARKMIFSMLRKRHRGSIVTADPSL